MSMLSSHFSSRLLLLLLLPLLLLISFATPTSSSSSTQAFIYSNCSQAKFMPGSAYGSTVSSLLTSIVNGAMISSYNNLTVPSSSAQNTPIYGLFQCRGDLAAAECSRCVAQAVSQLGTICPDSTGGALQLDGCLVMYDDSEFFGVEDKTLVVKKCGPSTTFTSNGLTRRDAVLSYLETSDGVYKAFRTTSLGNLQGIAQCVGDLSATDCQDCLSNAIGRLREECGAAQWGRVGLAKCYACFSEGGDYSPDENGERKNKNGDKFQKTQAIIVGVIAVVVLLIIFISFFTKSGESKTVVNKEQIHVENKEEIHVENKYILVFMQQYQIQFLSPTKTFCKSTLTSSTGTKTASSTPGRLSEGFVQLLAASSCLLHFHFSSIWLSVRKLAPVGSYVEWTLLHYLCKDRNGLLRKETVIVVYDGTLFHQMKKDHSSNTTL
ncbi:plasmodesmata-located protein 6 [Neltuma alba]|uniref:plasmodesmata-located protein 6 n=1 Tax=Neltuma alba TaxID=207710 RepID=UPI0010A50BF8|nr:plasmodesmata-located protein 6-like [Prosopis alba]